MADLTLPVSRVDRACPEGFPPRFVSGLVRISDEQLAASNPQSGSHDLTASHSSRVAQFAAHLGSRPADDPRLWALMVAASELRDDADPGKWQPGPEMRRVVSGLGRSGPLDVDMALTELVAAAVEDVASFSRSRSGFAEAERDRLRVEVEELRPFKERALAVEERLRDGQLAREVDMAALARAARLEHTFQYDAAPREDEAPEFEPHPLDNDRAAPFNGEPRHKQKVPGHPGVYFKVNARGEVYGYGLRLPRPGAPGKTDDAKRTFDTPAAALEARSEFFAEAVA